MDFNQDNNENNQEPNNPQEPEKKKGFSLKQWWKEACAKEKEMTYQQRLKKNLKIIIPAAIVFFVVKMVFFSSSNPSIDDFVKEMEQELYTGCITEYGSYVENAEEGCVELASCMAHDDDLPYLAARIVKKLNDKGLSKPQAEVEFAKDSEFIDYFTKLEEKCLDRVIEKYG